MHKESDFGAKSGALYVKMSNINCIGESCNAYVIAPYHLCGTQIPLRNAGRRNPCRDPEYVLKHHPNRIKPLVEALQAGLKMGLGIVDLATIRSTFEQRQRKCTETASEEMARYESASRQMIQDGLRRLR